MNTKINFESKIFLSSEIKKIEKKQLDKGVNLVEKASDKIVDFLISNYNNSGYFIFICGPGNNGADGLLTAYKIITNYFEKVIIVMPEKSKTSENKNALKKIKKVTSKIHHTFPAKKIKIKVIVDAIFGIGFNKIIDNKIQKIIEICNTLPCPKISIDMPSGISTDTGIIKNIAFRSDICLSFIGLKFGYFMNDGPDHYSKLVNYDLVNSEKLIGEKSYLINMNCFKNFYITKSKNIHKGNNGTLAIYGGKSPYYGALILSALSALKTGVGKVIIFVEKKKFNFSNSFPDIITKDLSEFNFNSEFSSILIGPGLKTNSFNRKIFEKILLRFKKTIIIDAGCFDLLVKKDTFQIFEHSKADIILTPHPKEASKLLNITTKEVNSNRIKYIKLITKKKNTIIILKGLGSLIFDNQTKKLFLNSSGSEVLATSGSGDVLAGLIGSLISQKVNTLDAVLVSVFFHGRASERKKIGTSMLELISYIRDELNKSIFFTKS